MTLNKQMLVEETWFWGFKVTGYGYIQQYGVSSHSDERLLISCALFVAFDA